MNDDLSHLQAQTDGRRSVATHTSSALPILFLLQLLASTADWMLIVYLQIQVFSVTGSAFSIMLLVLCELLPMLAVSPAAGRIADKHEARLILTMSCTAKALLVALFIFDSFRLNTIFLYCASAVAAILGRFFVPTAGALLPRLTPSHALPGANTIMMAMRTTGMAGGTVLAGITTTASALLTPSVLFAMIGASVLLSWMIPDCLPSTSHHKQTGNAGIGTFFKSNFGAFSYPLFASIQAMLALGAFEVLALVYITKVLHQPAQSVGWLFGGYGTGMLFGLLLASVRHLHQRVTTMLLSCMLVMPISIGALAFINDMVIAVACVSLAGLCESIVMTMSLLRIYRITPSSRHGSVIALTDTLSGSAFLVAVLVVGAMADTIDISFLLMTLSLLLLATLPLSVCLAFLCGREHTNRGDTAHSEDAPP